jgi:hypothetical protein
MSLVMLRPENMETDMRVMLSSHKASKNVKYLQGSPFQATDLARADATRAVAVFVM